MILSLLFIAVGLAILIYWADILIKGAGSISKKAGIPPLVVGLTVVAFGTSAPELIVNITAALNGKTDIAIGNILGSNIVNILLILGVTALMVNLKAQRSTTWKEVPFAFLAALIVFFLANDRWLGGGGNDLLSRADGFVFLGFFAIFLYYIYWLAKNGSSIPQEVDDIPVYGTGKAVLLTIGGLLGLFLGWKFFVEGAVDLARILWLSEILIGLTVVAVGTSLPEFAASVIAARRWQADIAIGNIVGSNIFNIFWILGVTSIIHPIEVWSTVNIDILVCMGSSFLMFLFLFFRDKHTLSRLHGIIFILIYVVYTAFLIVRG